MDHEKALEAISAALDGELTDGERAELEAHLETCPHCRELADDLGLLSAALRQQEELPEGLSRRLTAALEGEKTPKKKNWKRWAGLAAALVLVIGLGGSAIHGGLLPRMGGVSMDSASAPNTEYAGALENTNGAGLKDPSPEGVDWADQESEDTAINDSNGESEQYPVYGWTMQSVTYGHTPEAPCAVAVGSVEELKALLARFPVDELDRLAEQYGGEFFQSRKLVAVVVEANSGSLRYEVKALTAGRITLTAQSPDGDGTCDMAAWLLLVETADLFRGGETLEVKIEF